MVRDTVEKLASVDPGLTGEPTTVPIGEIELAKRGRGGTWRGYLARLRHRHLLRGEHTQGKESQPD
jgi:hypothetical protein